MTGAGLVNVFVVMSEGMSVVAGGGGILGVYEVTGENRPIFVESDFFTAMNVEGWKLDHERKCTSNYSKKKQTRTTDPKGY